MKASPFVIKNQNNQITLSKVREIKFTRRKRVRFYSYTKAGISIAKNTLKEEKTLEGQSLGIISQIHRERFGTQNQYVITGGHFHQLYVRNLGIFYNALLDPRIPLSATDWDNRQIIGLKTLALDLEVFSLAGRDYTTIIPLRGYSFTGLNIYSRPSDSLFAIFYTLLALIDDKFIITLFPSKKHTNLYKLKTINAGYALLKKYRKNLKKLLENYLGDILDKNTSLIRKNILLSSARDGIKRESSFYDNVIAWATVGYAKKLGILKISQEELNNWKKKIIQTFWDTEEKIFLDDLSQNSLKNKTFSADIFIAISTQFLNLKISQDRNYLEGMIQYVRRNKLDAPFPLHYAKEDIPKNLHRPVRHFAKSYMGKSIWSHWGMEYIKALILMSNKNPNFLDEAKKHLEKYKNNIERFGGYPELYKPNGNMYSSKFYKSVLINGWVVNYEQACMMIQTEKSYNKLR